MFRSLLYALALGLAGTIAVGCGNGQSTPLPCGAPGTRCGAPATGTKACTPLASKPAMAVALGRIFAVGRDPSDNTLYVVDNIDAYPPRVFVGDAMQLVQKRVDGGGYMIADGVRLDLISFEADSGPEALAIEQGNGQMRIAIVPSDMKASSLDGFSNKHALDALDVTSVAGSTALDLGYEVTIEYAARTPAGELLVVIHPRDSQSYDDYRIFYGLRSKLIERTRIGVTRAKDGGSTTIEFDLGEQSATASFPVVFADGGFEPGSATLALAGTIEPLTLESTDPATLSDAKFSCF